MSRPYGRSAPVKARGSVAHDSSCAVPRPSCAPGVQDTKRSNYAQDDPDVQAVLAEYHAGAWWTKPIEESNDEEE